MLAFMPPGCKLRKNAQLFQLAVPQVAPLVRQQVVSYSDAC